MLPAVAAHLSQKSLANRSNSAIKKTSGFPLSRRISVFRSMADSANACERAAPPFIDRSLISKIATQFYPTFSANLFADMTVPCTKSIDFLATRCKTNPGQCFRHIDARFLQRFEFRAFAELLFAPRRLRRGAHRRKNSTVMLATKTERHPFSSICACHICKKTVLPFPHSESTAKT